jgi:hypothetical protein
MALSDNPGGGAGQAANPKPDSQVVDDFHTNSDLDMRQESQHHTLGAGQNQAAPGNHTHRGGDSELLLTGLTITGSRGGNAALLSVINILVELGATNSSTA